MDARRQLQSRGLRAKKRLGQNFLVTASVAARIAGLVVDESGQRVLEVGAGTGILTGALLALGASVTAIEIDPELIEVLSAHEALTGASLIEADAMAYDYDAYAAGAPWRVAGNLPYNIGTPLLIDLATREHPPDRIVAMLQKDVVDRLVARPSTPAYGGLTLLAASRMTVKRAFTIGPSHFHPRPKVDSSVVVLDRRTEPINIADMTRFHEVVRGAFAYRRKTLANSLTRSLGIPREQTVAALRALALDPETRAEQLDLAAFVEFTNRLAG